MDQSKAIEEEGILVDLGAVSEETRGAEGEVIEQAEPLFQRA